MPSNRTLAPLLALLAAAVGGCAHQTRPGLDIDPRADEALRRMSTALAGASSFSFAAATTMDELIAPGQTAQVTRHLQVLVRRPDRLAVQSQQGDDTWSLGYQGNTLTLLDRSAKLYATTDAPGGIDRMLDDVARKYGLTVPLADLLMSDPYRALTARAHSGRYIGRGRVDGVECHHLLFTQEHIDWQIWIQAAGEPVPRKWVIDHKSIVERPQFTAHLNDWKLGAAAGDELFNVALPADARKVEMEKLLQMGRGE